MKLYSHATVDVLEPEWIDDAAARKRIARLRRAYFAHNGSALPPIGTVQFIQGNRTVVTEADYNPGGRLYKKAKAHARNMERAAQILLKLSAELTRLGWNHKGEVNHFSTGYVHPSGQEMPTQEALLRWAVTQAGFEERYSRLERSDGISPHQAFLKEGPPLAAMV